MPQPLRRRPQRSGLRRTLICSATVCRAMLGLLLVTVWVLYSQSHLKSLNVYDIDLEDGKSDSVRRSSSRRTSERESSSGGTPATQSLLPGQADTRGPTDYAGYLEATKHWTNSTGTCAYPGKNFYSGFKNQIMALTMIFMHASRLGCDQILVEKFMHKDTFGSNQMIPHIGLYDMVHFNSFYPKVPRLIRCEQEYLTEYDCSTMTWTVPLNRTTPPITSPIPIFGGKQHNWFGMYKRYSELTGKGEYAEPGKRHPVDLAILQGAQRPHPFMQEIIDNMLRKKFGDNAQEDATYMTLHARVEPDMLVHPMCPAKKEGNLTRIFAYLEETFPDPPAPFVFMPINRQYMEDDLALPQAVENLQALNDAVKNGLWGGRAKVFEFGANVLKGTRYERRSSIGGAMINYYVALGGNVFVGTEISTYAMDLMASRFYRGNLENYKYGPNGIERWMKEGDTKPPNFSCR